MSEANQGSVRYSTETLWGETPVGVVAKEMRITSEAIEHIKDTRRSQEVRADRQTVAILEVGQAARGPIAFELAHGDHEAWMKNFMREAIVSTAFAGSTTAAASSITGSTNADFTALQVGQSIRIESGGTNDGAIVEVVSRTSTVITTKGSTLSVGSMASVIRGNTLVNGVTKSSFFVETNFQDITAVKYFNGVRVNEMSLEVRASEIVTGTFTIEGKRGFAASVTVVSTLTSAGTTTPMTAAVNVGTIIEGGVPLNDAIQSISLTFRNNMFPRPQVGSKTTAAPGDGSVSIEGSLVAYFDNIRLYDKMINHTTTALQFRFTDDVGNVIVMSLPAIKLSGGNPGVPGLDQDNFITLAVEGFRDPTTGRMVRIDFLPIN